MSVGGGIGSIFGMNSDNEERQKQAQLEMQIQAQKRQAMELTARRDQLQNIRNTQIQRSMALNSATNQGAQFGTGLAGGYGQISGQSVTNAVGIAQNLEIGRNLFDLNEDISYSKMRQADAQTQTSMYAGISSFGNSLMGVSGRLGNLTAGFGNNNQQNFGVDTYGGQISRMGRGAIY